MSGEQPIIKLVITDLDDTLWRWPLLYVEAYRRMLLAISNDFGIPLEQLVTEVKAVHVEYHDTEYPLSILEIASMKQRHAGYTVAEMYEALEKYINIFNDTYSKHLKPSLFEPIKSTLRALQDNGIIVIGYTDANSCAITKRIHDFKLEQFYQKIYCRGEHALEGAIYEPWHVARGAMGADKLTVVDKTMAKPQAAVLAQILKDVNKDFAPNDQIQPSEVVYIGDSLERDMRMVQNFNATLAKHEAGMTAVHAEYGRKDDVAYQNYLTGITRAELMSFMTKISYWSETQNANEARSERDHHEIDRHYTLESNFGELLTVEPIAQTLQKARIHRAAEAALAIGSHPGLCYASESSRPRIPSPSSAFKSFAEKPSL